MSCITPLLRHYYELSLISPQPTGGSGDEAAVLDAASSLLPADLVHLKLGLKLKSVELCLVKVVSGAGGGGGDEDRITTLCHFSANNFALGLSQYGNGAMLVDFTLGDVNLVDARPESKTGINKIIGR